MKNTIQSQGERARSTASQLKSNKRSMGNPDIHSEDVWSSNTHKLVSKKESKLYNHPHTHSHQIREANSISDTILCASLKLEIGAGDGLYPLPLEAVCFTPCLLSPYPIHTLGNSSLNTLSLIAGGEAKSNHQELNLTDKFTSFLIGVHHHSPHLLSNIQKPHKAKKRHIKSRDEHNSKVVKISSPEPFMKLYSHSDVRDVV